MTTNDDTKTVGTPLASDPAGVERPLRALDLADHILGALPELRVHPTTKRIRAGLHGAVIVDSTRAVLVWEPGRLVPSYAVPVVDVDGSFHPTGTPPAEGHFVQVGDGPPFLDPSSPFSSRTTPGRSLDIHLGADAGATVLQAAAFAPAAPGLDDLIVLDFDAFDDWWEEDEPLVGHARDPFTTIDTRRSSRLVEVEIAGVQVAASTRSVMLFETYLPTRYYLPRSDVRMDLLRPSTTTTACSYKGRASYWSAAVDGAELDDVAWSYEDPHNYALLVRDLICFFNERVEIRLDGRPLEQPRTPWS